MKEFLESLNERENYNIFDEQLKAQVDFLWEYELKLLKECFIHKAKKVLDIGTGNGYFLKKLAKEFPEIEFVGVECDDGFVNIASNAIKESKLTNLKIYRAKCPFDCDEKFDFIMSRFAVYLMKNREDVFGWMHNHLNVGGTVFIMDIDDSASYIYPHFNEWFRLLNAIKEKTEANGGDRQVGRKLPYYLTKANFRNIDLKETYCLSTFKMGRKDFCDYFQHSATRFQKVLADKFTEKDLNDYLNFINQLRKDESIVAIEPIFIASGKKISRD